MKSGLEQSSASGTPYWCQRYPHRLSLVHALAIICHKLLYLYCVFLCLLASFCIQPRTTMWKKPRARTLEVHIDFRWRDQLPDQVAKTCQSDGIDWSQCNAVQWRKPCHIFAILYTPNVSCYIFCNGKGSTGYHWNNWDVLSHAVPQDFASNSPLGAMLNFPSSKEKLPCLRTCGVCLQATRQKHFNQR